MLELVPRNWATDGLGSTYPYGPLVLPYEGNQEPKANI